MIKHAAASRSKNFFLGSKKTWLIGGVILLALGSLIGFVLFSRYAWDKYENDYVAWHTNIESRVDRSFALSSSTADDRMKKLAALQSLNDDIKGGAKQCAAYGWLHWQKVIDAVEQKINKCKLLADRVGKFGNDLGIVTDHLLSDKATSLVIVDTHLANGVKESDLAAVKDHWAKVVASLEKQKVSKTFLSTNKLAIEKAKMVRDAWQAVLDANVAKDRSRYEASVNTLKSAYDGLAAIGVSSEKALLPLLDVTQKSYDQVFEKG